MKSAERQLRLLIREVLKEEDAKSDKKDAKQASKTEQNFEVKTVGDLKKVIRKSKISRLTSSAKSYIPDAIVAGLKAIIPGVETAKTVFDVIKAVYDKPSTSKVSAIMRPLRIDDYVSKIVDDKIEDAFVAYLADVIDDVPDDFPLQDFDADKMFKKFLAQHFDNRTVTGYQEG